MQQSFEAVSSRLTPNEIKNKEFKRTMWGYSPKEVIEFLDRTARAWELVQKHERELIQKADSLREEIRNWQLRESQIGKIHEKALKDAEQMRLEATGQAETIFKEVEERANQIRIKTEVWLEKVISEVAETERQKSNFMSAFKSALDSHYELLNQDKIGEPLGSKLGHFLKTEIEGEEVSQ